MCGVVAIVGPWSRDQQTQLAQAMAARLAHRGPDGQGCWYTPLEGGFGLTLAHRRLAIVELSTDGAQPMQRGPLHLTFNGEVYNHDALRAELREQGATFATRTDTEVLLALCERDGPERALQRVNGPLAMVLWDEQQRTLWLARDRFGKKPLYYLRRNDALLVASEPKALRLAAQRLQLPLSVDKQTLACYLADAETDIGDATFYAEIKRVAPGELLAITLSPQSPQPLQLRRSFYYQLTPPPPCLLAEKDADARFVEVLTDALRLRLRCDVQVGAALSGGMDSSTLVCLAAQLGQPLQTFSAIHRPGEAIDEREYIAAVVAHTGVANLQVVSDAELEPATFADFIAHHDEPVGGASVWVQRSVFRLAAQSGVRVVLSGQGADECLSGYSGAFSALTAELLRRGAWSQLQRELSQTLPPVLGPMLLRKLLAASWTVARTFWLPTELQQAALARRWQHAFADTRYLQVSQLPKVPLPLSGPSEPAFAQRSLLHAYLYRLLTGASLATILRYEDRNSMAASIETRAPFLDHRLVELCLSLPATALVRDGRTKALLRRALGPILPATVASRRDKVGFAGPEARLLLGPLRPLVLELLDSATMNSRGLFSCAALRHHYQQANKGLTPLDSYPLWKALNVELWLRASGLSL